VPLKPIELKGLLARTHTYSPNLVHLELSDNFNESLLDFRDYLIQPSPLRTFRLQQWIVCDHTFCGYFAHLTTLKLQVQSFTFMKKMKYPSQLKVLEIQIETLGQSFIGSILESALCLAEVTVKFGKVDTDSSWTPPSELP